MKKIIVVNCFIIVLFGSCQNTSKESVNALADVSVAEGKQESVSDFTGDTVKLVKTGAIRIKVKNVEQSAKELSVLTDRYDGMVFNKSYNALEGDREEFKISTDSLLQVSTYTPQADISIRVPSEKLEQFLFDVADRGYFTGSSSLNIDDKSLAYLENILKQKNRTDVLNERPPVSKAPSSLNKIDIKDQVTEQQILNRRIDKDVKYSLVTLNLYQNTFIKKEVIANYNIADYKGSFGVRFRNAVSDGWHSFLGLVIIFANLWVFILLLIIAWLIYKVWFRKSILQI